MEKYFTLNKAPYKGVNTIRVSSKYDKKNAGYIITSECVERNNGIIGKPFCKEYYQSGGDGISVIIPAERQNAKKKAEADAICERDAEKYAHIHLQHINENLGTNVEIV